MSSRPFRLGYMTHVEGPDDPATIYAQTLDIFTAADELGFDAVWVAQHHFHSQTAHLPSPFPFLAAAAERTQQIRLGTSIVIMPFETPLRVAEDAAVVDVLSGERLELGVGSGSDPGEFQAFGRDIAQRHMLTTEGINTLKRALRGETLSDDGKRLQPAAPTLVNRLWQAALSEMGARYVAKGEAGLLLARAAWRNGQPTDEVQIPVAEAYLEEWTGNPEDARIGLSRGIYLAKDRQTALAEIGESVMQAAERQIKLGNFPPDLPLERYCERMHILYGAPQDVAEGLSQDKMLAYASDLMLQFNPVVPSAERSIEMLQQIAEEVAPELGWRPKS